MSAGSGWYVRNHPLQKRYTATTRKWTIGFDEHEDWAPPREVRPPHNPRAGGGRSFSVFSHRNYRLYWLGQLVSIFGTWMQSIGQTWLVLQLTHSAFQIGLVGALQGLPILFFSLVGGVFADLWPKRRVLFLTQALSMAQALALFGLVATHSLALWELYLLALLLGVTNCVYRPTSQAFLAELGGETTSPVRWLSTPP